MATPRVVDAKLLLFLDGGEIEWRTYINVAVSHRPSAGDESVEDAIEAELAPYWDDDEQGGTVWQLDLKQGLSPKRG